VGGVEKRRGREGEKSLWRKRGEERRDSFTNTILSPPHLHPVLPSKEKVLLPFALPLLFLLPFSQKDAHGRRMDVYTRGRERKGRRGGENIEKKKGRKKQNIF
jgi:hypothetical protein